MEKQIDHFVAEHYIRHIPEIKSESLQRQRELDKSIVWLASLSTAAIGFLIIQSKNILISDPIYLKVSITGFVCCIFFSAIFRSFSFLFEEIQSILLFNFQSFCYGFTANIKGPRELEEDVTKENIAKYLKEDMGIDYHHWLEHEYLNIEFWIELYENWSNHWKKSEINGLKSIGRAYAPLLNKHPNETENLFLPKIENTSKSFKHAIIKSICKISYNLILITFCLGVISISLGYVLN